MYAIHPTNEILSLVQILVVSVLVIGSLFSVIFHLGTNENNNDRAAMLAVNHDPDAADHPGSNPAFHWFKSMRFYQVSGNR